MRKRILCYQIGGSCDKPIIGKTQAEMVEKIFKHASSIADPEHSEYFFKLKNMSESERREWGKKLTRAWKSAPGI